MYVPGPDVMLLPLVGAMRTVAPGADVLALEQLLPLVGAMRTRVASADRRRCLGCCPS